MHKGFLKTAAILGFLSVALGAFAAHTLKQKLPEAAVSIFETGVRYQFYHTFALLVTAIVYREYNTPLLRWSGILFIIGIVLFSGSLYFLTYIKGTGMTGFEWVGAITPVGGLSFLLGWTFLFIGVSRKSSSTQ